MRVIFGGSCPKDSSTSDINEDYWTVSESAGVLALCDGASESFDSAMWARVLAEKFVKDQSLSPRWIGEAITEYEISHDFASMSWSRQASYEKGSFSTLLGLQYIWTNRTVEVLAVGDSLAVLIDGTNLVGSWPFSRSEAFKSRPTLLSTVHAHNQFLSESDFWTMRGVHFDLNGLIAPKLVCVTDALGEWLLSQVETGEDGLAKLLSITSEEELAILVQAERDSGRMRVDDSTLVILEFGSAKELDSGLSLI